MQEGPRPKNFSKRLRLLSTLLWVLTCLNNATAFAAPREIIIVRHAEKWPTKHHGPTLDPTGYMRAVRLAHYILDKFGEPDFLIATDPSNQNAHTKSIRELQTLAPLSSMLAKPGKPTTSSAILHPYKADQYKDLASLLLTDDRFSGKSARTVQRATRYFRYGVRYVVRGRYR